jgi:GH35 family endo-1,4-beta-xylanase
MKKTSSSRREFLTKSALAAGAFSAARLQSSRLGAAMVAACAQATSAFSASEPARGTAAAPTLRETFKDTFLIGTAIRPDQINGQNPQAAALILREFNCITAENAMKMGPIHPRPGNDPASYDFAAADAIVGFAEKNHLKVIGHTLCWHAQMSRWMSEPEPGQPELTKEVLTARLRDHITTVAGRYKGRIHGWDVVNEAINDGAGDYRPSIFFKVLGKEYLALAFKWAREADPGAELYYNDYNLDANDNKRATALALVKYLREQGCKIDGIGLQGHYNLTTPSIAKIDETIALFAALGLKVHITELDVTAIRGASVSGAVGFSPGQRPFPTVDQLKTQLMLTDTQVAKITPLVESTTKDIQAAAAGSDFQKVGQLRTAAADAIRQLLTEPQQAPFNALINPPNAGRGRGGPPPPLSAEDAQAQAKRYAEIFGVFMKHRAAIARVTFWGLRDTDSWRRQFHPLIFDDTYGRKPAYDAIIAARQK